MDIVLKRIIEKKEKKIFIINEKLKLMNNFLEYKNQKERSVKEKNEILEEISKLQEFQDN